MSTGERHSDPRARRRSAPRVAEPVPLTTGPVPLTTGPVPLTTGPVPLTTGPVPLTTLLSWTWVAFAIEADNAAEAAGSEHVGRLFRISVAVWANGLRLIDEGGTTVDELRYHARAACNIGGLERWGSIFVGDVATKRREGYGSHRGLRGATVLRPTRAGSYARRLWPRVVARVEERWQVRFGTEIVGLLRDALAPFAGRMPWSPPEVHPSDGFCTHLFDGPTAADDDDHAPLVALLGQALTALTLEHERDAEVSLPTAANLLRLIGDRVLRIRDLPLLSGVSKEAVAMAVNYLLRAHLAEPRHERSIALTVTGLDGARRLPGEGRSLQERGPPTRARGGRVTTGGHCQGPRPTGWVLARRKALFSPDATTPGRPPGRAAMAPDGAAPWWMARWLLGPRYRPEPQVVFNNPSAAYPARRTVSLKTRFDTLAEHDWMVAPSAAPLQEATL